MKTQYRTHVDEVVPVDKTTDLVAGATRATLRFVNSTICAYRRNAPTIGKGVRNAGSILGTILMTAGSWTAYGLGKAASVIESHYQDNQTECEVVDNPIKLREVS